MFKLLSRFSITTLLTLAMLVPLVVLGVALELFAVKSVEKSSQAMGQQILDESARRVDQDVFAFLNQAKRVSDLLAGLVSDGVLSSHDFDPWIDRFFIRLRTTPEIASICFTNAGFETLYLMRYPPDLELGLGQGPAGNLQMKSYVAYSDGRRASEPTKTYSYDPRDRPWWKIAIASQEPIWTPAYEWFASADRKSESQVAMAYTRRVVGKDGTNLGVLSVDATLDQINNHLTKIRGARDTLIVITDQDGRIIGTSLPTAKATLRGVADLRTSADAGERDVADLLDKASQSTATSSVLIGSTRRWVRQAPIMIGPGGQWTMTLAVSDGQLLKDSKLAVMWIKVLAPIYIIGCAGGATLLAWWISRPVRRLVRFARTVGQGEFKERVNVAGTSEFQTLSTALNQMAENLEEQVHLQAHADAAHQAAAMKSRLIAHVSHELRTPLNAIIGYTEMIEESAGNPEQQQTRKDAGRVLQASRHLLRLINNLLDLSRIEAGRMELQVMPFDICEMVNEVADTVRPVVCGPGNQLTIECPSDIGEMTSDPGRLKQVLINLLGNAGKFTTEGMIQLKVGSDSDRIRFQVIDNGPGMSQEQQIRLFEPFSPGQESGTQPGGGAGLGLAISKQLTQVLGGTINVKSHLRVGTQFTVEIPRKFMGKRDFQLTYNESGPP